MVEAVVDRLCRGEVVLRRSPTWGGLCPIETLGVFHSADATIAARRMSDESNRGFRLFLEGLVVLLSILAAFFLEGWRADRELARELSQELVSVRGELERNRELIDAELQSLSRVEAAALALGDLLGASDARQVSVPDTLALLGVQWAPSFSGSFGAVTALISSGRLAQVEDPTLRVGLAGLDAAISDALEEELFARQITVEQLLPLIGQEAEWRVITDLARSFFGLEGAALQAGLTPQERNRDRAAPGGAYLVIPNTAAVRSALGRRIAWTAAARAEFSGVAEHLEDLIARIPSEVN